MIRLAFSRRRRRHEDTLDNIDALEVELGFKPRRERETAASAWAASVAEKEANYSAGINPGLGAFALAIKSGRWAPSISSSH